MSASRVIDGLSVPILGAPMAGGPSTPELAAAVGEAGGLGSLAGGYLTASAVAERIESARSLRTGALALNVFSVETVHPEPAVLEAYAAALAPWAERLGLPAPTVPVVDDEAERAEADEIVRTAIGTGIELVTFTFGPPTPTQAQALHASGSELGITVASVPDARAALALAPQVLIVQGPEAGGHRSTADQRESGDPRPLPELLADVRALVGRANSAPALVAAGGVGDRKDVRSLLAGGADAVQVGTALLLSDEAGTSAIHRRALHEARAGAGMVGRAGVDRAGDDSADGDRTSDQRSADHGATTHGATDHGVADHLTAITRVFSGRAARGLENEAMRALGPAAVVGYPHVHRMTAPLRAAATGPEWTSLWAGTGHTGIRTGPAAGILRDLAP